MAERAPLPLREPEYAELELDDIGPRGDATTVDAEGKPIYVAWGIPGERVRARIYKRGRHSTSADTVEILRASPHRVTPPCPLFGHCNGCQLQHIAIEYQLELKQRMVVTQLVRFGDFVDPPVPATIAAPVPWHYRNHARFTVRDGRLGYVRRHRRAFFEVPRCLIMEESINAVLAQLQGRLHETTQCNVRVGPDPGQVAIQPKLSLVDIESGQTHVRERLCGREFEVSTAAFFQVHRAQAERMIELVRDAVLAVGARTVVDAYAGVGTIAALLAPWVERVIAIEESGPAVRDAERNIAGLDNVELCLGRTEIALARLAEESTTPVDAIVLDPPRSGCLRPALDAVVQLRPKVVVYVSCDPATLARDLRILCDGGFTLTCVQPLDMFPHTVHVECVATLHRRE
ncbi:MAG: class I SAM-dependent RNA methyltransferase [Deltaproteobacteria bacterium]|nr:class I SAM-dependent RNA methyltransferase [Nannocystaceae bacterium]